MKLFLSISLCLIIGLISASDTIPVDEVKTMKIRRYNEFIQKAFSKDILPVDAADYAKKALNIALEMNDDFKRARAYTTLGAVFYDGNDYRNSLKYYLKAINVYKELNDTASLSSVLNNIGLIYDNHGDFGKALDYYLKSYNLSTALKDTGGTATSLNNIATIYLNIRHLDRAEFYLRQTASLNTQINDTLSMGICYNNMGEIYRIREKYSEAEKYYKDALAKFKQMDYERGIITSINNLGEIYMRTNRLEPGFLYTQDALERAEKEGILSSQIQSFLNLGIYYRQKKQDKKALEYIYQALKLSEKLNFMDRIIECYQNLYLIYKEQGNYKKSIEYLEIYTNTKDSVNALNYEKISDLQTHFETQKKEDEILILKKDKKIKDINMKRQDTIRNFLLLGFFLILILFLVILRYYYKKRQTAKTIEIEKQKADNLLLNILPEKIANELKLKGTSKPERFEDVTIVMADIVGFTKIAKIKEPEELVDMLNKIFTAFDEIVDKQECLRIKTIGDAYMAVCGMPYKDKHHTEHIVEAALEMMSYINFFNSAHGENLEMRIGIHTGPVVGSIIGIKKYLYDVFGDTVNIASRMEEYSVPGQINISETTKEKLPEKYIIEKRPEKEVKGIGTTQMYFVKGVKE